MVAHELTKPAMSNMSSMLNAFSVILTYALVTTVRYDRARNVGETMNIARATPSGATYRAFGSTESAITLSSTLIHTHTLTYDEGPSVIFIQIS